MQNIGSYTFQFDFAEDRIRVIGNLNNGQPRMDFWLTRRLTLKLLDAANQLVRQTSERVSQTPQAHQGEMAEFEHQKAQQQMQLNQEPVPPLSTDQGGIQLLHRIDISFKQNSYILLLFCHSQEAAVASSTLTYDELHQIFHLIHTGCEKLEWGVSPQLFASQAQNQTTLQ